MTNTKVNIAWKDFVKTNEATSADFVILAALKAINAKTNSSETVLKGLLKKYFTPITNTNKLSNGQRKWSGLEHAVTIARYRIRSFKIRTSDEGAHKLLLDVIKTEEDIQKLEYLMTVLPKISYYEDEYSKYFG